LTDPINFTPNQLRRIAGILESNDDQPGFDFWSAVAAAETEDPAPSDATRAAFLLAADTMNNLALLARADPAVKPELAAKINEWQQNLSTCDWPILDYDTSDPPTQDDSVKQTLDEVIDEATAMGLLDDEPTEPIVYVRHGHPDIIVEPSGTVTQGDSRFAQFPTATEACAYLEDIGWERANTEEENK
jgi:hypothetical protein